ncbi:hypothetical protein [Nostoc sp.]|uniref:hypothetical protein n=1 Tax=Nostoc sp. TaxID=1180 RepID=UPI002FF978E3
MNTSYTIRKKLVLYLLLENNRAMPAAGYAYAGYTKALEFRNGKSFRRVTEEGYNTIHLKFRTLRKKRIILKLALQRLEVSTSQRITDGIRDFELLLPWCITGYGCW